MKNELERKFNLISSMYRIYVMIKPFYATVIMA